MRKPDYGIKRKPPAFIGKIPKLYPWLSEDRHCDICVIGGGLTGAMCAMAAAEMGLSVTLITSGGVGFGSTGHSTGCAQFDCGSTLTEADRVMSTDEALRLYALGFEALDDLGNLCNALDGEYKKSGLSADFIRRDSLLFTSDPTELELMEREYIARNKKFSGCTFITRKTAENSFEFPICGGILTKEGGAALNPYALAHLCLMKAEELGAGIFEQTEALDIQTPKKNEGCVIIKTSTYRTIYADRLIFATGSKGIRAMTERSRKYISFTEIAPLPEGTAGWSGKCILRTFGGRERNGISSVIRPDGKIAVSTVCKSGIIEKFSRRDETNFAKYDKLRETIQKLLPDVSETKIQYEYSYEFSAIYDELPIIGRHEEYKNCLFALCGLSGIFTEAALPVFSQIARNCAVKMLESNSTENDPLFDPMRL